MLLGQNQYWPQGPVLGPLLFIIFINDIVNIVNDNIKLFTDDTTLYLSIKYKGTTANILNTDLFYIDAWSTEYLMP